MEHVVVIPVIGTKCSAYTTRHDGVCGGSADTLGFLSSQLGQLSDLSLLHRQLEDHTANTPLFPEFFLDYVIRCKSL